VAKRIQIITLQRRFPAMMHAKMPFRVCLIGLLSLALAVPAFGAGGKAKPGVLVKMGKTAITQADFDTRIDALPPEYRNRFKSDAQKKEFLEMLVQANLLALEARAKKMDKDTVMAARLDDAVNSILAQEYLKRIFDRGLKVTDADIAAYYGQHKAEFTNPEMVKAQHILVKTAPDAKPEDLARALEKAKKIKDDLNKGADFGKLAEQHSDDPGSKAKDGDLGFFTRDRMVPEFSQAAFALSKGQISEPVKSYFGYHLIKVTDRRDAQQMDLNDASPRIRSKMENERRKAAMDAEIDRLKKKFNVTFTDAGK
jgi:peptidyl-prolyl cis-trans isomerase C